MRHFTVAIPMIAEESHFPEIPGPLSWLNVDKPVRLSELRGRVVLLNFATYCSLHCLHVIADLDYLVNKYPNEVVVIGVHGPRFPAEKSAGHVHNAISRNHVRHPVIHDPDCRLWSRFGIRSGSALAVIDTRGSIVGSVSGEGNREKLEQIIAALLARRERPVTGLSAPYTLKQAPEVVRPLSFPGKILATENRVYIADGGHNRILSTSPRGLILHQYGDGNPGFIDGNGFSAAFDGPQAMVLVDEFLYVADTGNHAIRRINVRNDDVVTIAGSGAIGMEAGGDYFGNPREVDLNSPSGLAHKASVLYIAMTGLHQIWSLSLVTNTLEIFAGSGEEGLADGASWNACFAYPCALSIIGHILYVVDAGSSAIRAVDLNTRQVTTLVGRGLSDYGDRDGPGTAARLQQPLDITADQTRKSLWVADTYNNKIRKIRVDNQLVSSYHVNRQLNEPGGLAFSGNTLYIANTNCHEIVRINLHSGITESLNVSDKYIGL
jgi:DNA-binding beta-propeller fold protein YncE